MATRKRIRAPGSTTSSRVLLMYEEMKTHFQALQEGLSSTRDEMKRKFEEMSARVDLRFEALEIAVKMNSADIRQNSADIRKNSEGIEKLQHQVEGLTHVVAGKADERALASLEARVARLE